MGGLPASQSAALLWMCNNWFVSGWATTNLGDQLPTGTCVGAVAVVCTCTPYPCSQWPYVNCSSDSAVVSINIPLTTARISGPDGSSDPVLDASIGNLINLTYLNFHDNYFRSPIPDSFGNLIYLNFLDLYDNYINGTLPASLGNCSQMGTFDVHDNSDIYGTIPASWTNWKNLQYLDVSDLMLWGTLPAFTAPNLNFLSFGGQVLYLSNNYSISTKWPGSWLNNTNGTTVNFATGNDVVCCSTLPLTVGGLDLVTQCDSTTVPCPATVVPVPPPLCCCGGCSNGGSTSTGATTTGATTAGTTSTGTTTTATATTTTAASATTTTKSATSTTAATTTTTTAATTTSTGTTSTTRTTTASAATAALSLAVASLAVAAVVLN